MKNAEEEQKKKVLPKQQGRHGYPREWKFWLSNERLI